MALLAAEPRIGVLECARRLGVARGTAQARLDRLQARGVITGFGPDIDLAAIGFDGDGVRHAGDPPGPRAPGGRRRTWPRSPKCCEVHTVTGQGDLLCRIVARSNADLQRVIDEVVAGRRTSAGPRPLIALADADPVPGAPAGGERGLPAATPG